MKLQVIQLEAHDDVTSVRDRLSFVKADRVLLVWPRDTSILCRKLDLVLIQREAARRKAKLALVTTDLQVIENADALNISTFKSIKAGQTIHWKQPLNKVFIDRSDRPVDAPDHYELMLAASRLKRLTPQQRRFRQVIRQMAVVALIVTLLIVIYLVAPGADITLTPAQDQLHADVLMTADSTLSTIDVTGGRIPATIDVIDVQTDATIPTTSSTSIPNTVASGLIIFSNQTNTQIFVPTGTIITTLATKPIKFHTTADVTVNAGVGVTASVPIEALQESAGPAGNLDANLIVSIQGPLSKTLSAYNPDQTKGGTFRQVGVVTKADWDNLLVLAREKLRQTALAQFSPRLTGTQFVSPDSIKIVEERPEWTTYSAFIGDPADNLTLTLRAKVQALVVDEQQARQVAFARLVSKMSAGREISPLSVAYSRGPIQKTDDKGNVTFLMSASANVAIVINPDMVRQKIAGVSVGDAQDILHQTFLLDPAHPPQIQIWPPIWGRLPVLPLRINVIIQD